MLYSCAVLRSSMRLYFTSSRNVTFLKDVNHCTESIAQKEEMDRVGVACYMQEVDGKMVTPHIT